MLLFDGAKHQIIKLDASIGLKKAAEATISEASNPTIAAPGPSKTKKHVSYSEEMDDPLAVIRQNKQQVEVREDRSSEVQAASESHQEDEFNLEVMLIELEHRKAQNVKESQGTLQ